MSRNKTFLTWTGAAFLIAGLCSDVAQAEPSPRLQRPTIHVREADVEADVECDIESDDDADADGVASRNMEPEDSDLTTLPGKSHRGRGGSLVLVLAIALVNFVLGFGARHALPIVLRALGESRSNSML